MPPPLSPTSTAAVATPNSLPRWQKRSVYAATALLSVTGLVWLALHFLFADGEGRAFDAASLQASQAFEGSTVWSLASVTTCKAWLIRWHAAAALWFCVVVGSLLPSHILGAWYSRRNRSSGVANVATSLVLLTTGYSLWYAPDGNFRLSAEWLHWGVGAALPCLVWLHVRWGKKLKFFR